GSVREIDGALFRRAEAGAGLDRAVPVWRPRAVGITAARLPAQHCRVPVNAQRGAQLRQDSLRVGEHVIAIDEGRRPAEPVSLALEEIRLAIKREILEPRALALP